MPPIVPLTVDVELGDGRRAGVVAARFAEPSAREPHTVLAEDEGGIYILYIASPSATVLRDYTSLVRPYATSRRIISYIATILATSSGCSLGALSRSLS